MKCKKLYYSWSKLLLLLLVINGIISQVSGNPVNFNESWKRTVVESDEVPDDFCYPFEVDANTTNIQLLGQTTVLFKMSQYKEDSWDVTMTLDLKERFTNRGFKAAHFIIIVPPSTILTGDELTDVNSTTLWTSDNNSNISVIYDTEDLEHLAPESVTVIDSCGNLAYTIFYPWSSLEYPYVKAAVLSSMFDQPCYSCAESSPLGNSLRHPLFDRPVNNGLVLDLDTAEKESRQVAFEEFEKNANNSATTSTTTTPSEDEDANYIIPLRVIFPAEHVHRDSENPFGKFKKYNYYVLRTDNQSYHGHLDSDPPDIVGIYRDLDAGIFPIDPEDDDKLSTTTTPTTETTEAATTISEDEPETNSLMTTTTTTTGDEDVEQETSSEESLFFGFSSNSPSKISFTETNNNDISATTAAPETTTRESKRRDPLIYVNNEKEKFRVRKKYRFGEHVSNYNYNPRDFDEVEVLRDEVKTFITELGQAGKGQEKETTRRTVNEHYEIMLPWLDYNL